MSEDPATYEVPIKIKYLDIAVDYLRGLPYSFICEKYDCNNGYIQYALERAGVETNRIKSGARLNNGRKKRIFSKELIEHMKENTKINKCYNERKRHLHCTMGKQKDNNPVHMVDDLDIMERMNGTDGADDLVIDKKSLQYEIVITEGNNINYMKGGEN